MKFITRLPLADNNGKRFPDSLIRGIIRELAVRFGGASVEGPHEGLWYHEGRIYDDESLKVEVIADNSRIDEAREIVREIGKQLQQIRMYFEVIESDGVEFLDSE